MKGKFAKTLMGLASVCAIAACSDGFEATLQADGKSAGAGGTNTAEEVGVEMHANLGMSADQLVSMGEALMTEHTFLRAQRIFQVALDKDPSNFKANLYNKLINTITPFRGALGEQNSYFIQYFQVSDLGRGSLRYFLEAQGNQRWTNPNGIQKTIVEYRDSLIDLYQFLSQYEQQGDLEVKISSWAFVNDLKGLSEQDWTVDGELNSDMVARCSNCMGGVLPTRTLTNADLIAFRQIVGGMALYTVLATTYQAGGSFIDEDTLNAHKGSLQDLIEMQRESGNSSLGLLAENHRLDFLKQLGPDTVSAIEWAKTHSQGLCTERPHMIFEEGICISSDLKTLNTAGFSQAFTGTSNITIDTGRDGAQQIAVNLASLIDNPFEDFLAYETRFGDCGEIFSEPTLGGVFPDGISASLLEKSCRTDGSDSSTDASVGTDSDLVVAPVTDHHNR